MASNKLTVSDLDFDNVKTNLKTFLQSQSEFQDYDFEGSGFAVLLDLLAYNTHYLGKWNVFRFSRRKKKCSVVS